MLNDTCTCTWTYMYMNSTNVCAYKSLAFMLQWRCPYTCKLQSKPIHIHIIDWPHPIIGWPHPQESSDGEDIESVDEDSLDGGDLEEGYSTLTIPIEAGSRVQATTHWAVPEMPGTSTGKKFSRTSTKLATKVSPFVVNLPLLPSPFSFPPLPSLLFHSSPSLFSYPSPTLPSPTLPFSSPPLSQGCH